MMEKTGGSRLMQMQARFQQKQLAEREMKIASLYEAQQARALGRVRQSPSNNSVGTAASLSAPLANMQPGKVRQMFDERRTKGIDKSYPLQPIQNTRRNVINGHTKPPPPPIVKHEKKEVRSNASIHSVRKREKANDIKLGSGDLNHNKFKQEVDIVNEVPSLVELESRGYRLEDETFPDVLGSQTPTPRSPTPPPPPTRPQRRSPANKISPTKKEPVFAPPRPPRQTTVNTIASAATKSKSSDKKPTSGGTSNRSLSRATVGGSSASDGEPCSVCGRRFAADRLPKHEDICRKTASKRRKPYDVLKHRLEGTEAEPFLNKLRKGTATTGVNKPLNPNWRQKHQDFINAIRAAKGVQAHLNAGGKLSDLPPPPPSTNPDYIQCPHCGRRFNAGAADRHIPKCATFLHNKPKPTPSVTKRR